jgi:ABC-2 type transport system permease protein
MKVIYMIRKDLIMILSDKKALAIILAMPVILMVILSFALKGVFTGEALTAERIKIAVVREYDAAKDEKSFKDSLNSGMLPQNMGEASVKDIEEAGDEIDPDKIFFHDFLGSDDVSDIISYRTETEAEAKRLLKEGKVSAVVILPEKYFYNMKVNLVTPFRNEIMIRVLKSPDAHMEGQIVQSVIQSFSDSISSVVIGKNVLIESAMEHNISKFQDMRGAVKQMRDALNSISITWKDTTLEGKRTITSADYYAAAMLTMFILFEAGHGGRMLLEEKENSTYQRMMTAGISKLLILAGKMITVFLIALIQITVMMIFSHFALNVIWGGLSLRCAHRPRCGFCGFGCRCGGCFGNLPGRKLQNGRDL